jgi:hypothetical protein
MNRVKKYTAFVILLAVFPLFAQITIDWTEIPQNNGTTWTKNSVNEVTVYLGTQGGPQTWTFTSQPMGTDSAVLRVVPVASTPYADTFPDANLVYRGCEEGDTSYQYYDLAPAYMCMLGLGMVSTDTNAVFCYDPADSIPLPVNYGDSVHYFYSYTIDLGMGPLYDCYFDMHGWRECDAYGTVTIPYNTYPCLRVCSFDTCDFVIDSAGVNVFFQRTTHIDYEFVAEYYSSVVCIKSHAEETNPNYTDAQLLERLTHFAQGIEEARVEADILLTHGPNPFSDKVSITYALPSAGHVGLNIYDKSGRLVNILVNESQGQGEQRAVWNGRDGAGKRLPNGVYFYCLRIGEKNYTGKMLMLK